MSFSSIPAIARAAGGEIGTPVEPVRLQSARAQSLADSSAIGLLGAAGAAAGTGLATFAHQGWTAIAAWGCTAVLLHAMQLLIASRPSAGRWPVPMALMLGAVWAAGLVSLLGTDPALQPVLLIYVGTIAAAIGVTMTTYPAAAAAFGTPVAIGALACLVRAGLAGEVSVAHALPLLMLAALVPIAGHRGREFARAVAELSHLRESDRIVALLLADHGEGSRDWLWSFDAQGRITRASAGLSATTFLRPDQLVGLDFMEFLSCITAPDDLVMQELRRDVGERLAFNDVEVRLNAFDETAWRLSGQPVFSEGGAYAGYIGIGTDISERRRSERRMALLAHNDVQTGLYNRTKFTETLAQCVARLERYGSPFALFYLDLDNFKLINDSRGHMAGDHLLVEVAHRIRATVGETDFAARLGGDEFALILTEDVTEEACRRLAERLLGAIARPIEIEGEPLSVGVSIGIAIAPLDGTRPDQLQRNADLALYRAKDDGRSVYRLFESEMDADAREKRLLEMELRDALRRGELILHYQPLVSATDKTPTGFEALVRWQHPIRGVIGPSEFIPIAEQSSLIVEIGDWTIAEVCRVAARWPEGLSVAVNLSAKHFRLSDISSAVRGALQASGLAPHRLEVEITEGLLMTNEDEVTAKLEQLRALGVTIVMDDFGTGYSSLSYLLKFPFDKIKIDRSFVTASSTDPMARDILRAISSLGKTLRLQITAEGVETPEQAEFLSEIACHQLQGFFFARPLDHLELPGYLLANVAAAARRETTPQAATSLPAGGARDMLLAVAAEAEDAATGTAG